MTITQRLQALDARGFDDCRVIERDDAGRFDYRIRVKCSQCEALVIQGLACHETGCPHSRRRPDLDTEEDF